MQTCWGTLSKITGTANEWWDNHTVKLGINICTWIVRGLKRNQQTKQTNDYIALTKGIKHWDILINILIKIVLIQYIIIL